MKTAKHTICHVGYTCSGDDLERVVRVFEWLRKEEIKLPRDSVFLDLSDGKDFLSLKGTYDVVVLHFVCRWEKCHMEQLNKVAEKYLLDVDPRPLQTSPLASWSNWRKKLVETKASYIHLFGGQEEVSGGYIVNLPGYKRIKLGDVEHRGFPTEWYLFEKENKKNK